LKVVNIVLFLVLCGVSCTGQKSTTVSYAKEGHNGYYTKIYHNYKVSSIDSAMLANECKVTVSLDAKKEKIIDVHTNCMLHLGFERFIDDFVAIVKRFHLENLLQKSDIIKVSTFQGIVPFPNFAKHLNKQYKKTKALLEYSPSASLKEISKNYHRKLAKLIKDSGLYVDKINSLSIKNCTAKVDFSYWNRDKSLYTVPKSTTKYHIVMHKVISTDGARLENYPDIPYLPIRIKCEKSTSQ